MRRFQPPLSWGVSGRMPPPDSWLLAFLQLHLAIWVRGVQLRESLFSGDWIVRSSCLLKPAEAKRRNSLLRYWDIPWNLKAGSIAGREPEIGKSGTGVCALSFWGCWVSYHLPPQTSFWLQHTGGRGLPNSIMKNFSVWISSIPASVSKLLRGLSINSPERSRLAHLLSMQRGSRSGVGWDGSPHWWDQAGHKRA